MTEATPFSVLKREFDKFYSNGFPTDLNVGTRYPQGAPLAVIAPFGGGTRFTIQNLIELSRKLRSDKKPISKQALWNNLNTAKCITPPVDKTNQHTSGVYTVNNSQIPRDCARCILKSNCYKRKLTEENA